ncbi:MAG: deoxyribodipyrimidine photo-lyase [Gammaproteobacteria bacterium]|nr:deoxyribodipyrimidine photo-lyase [Gammaproteobacteria bacterium]
MSNPAIVWFRQDLRLSNNPALAAALDKHERVIPVFVHEQADTAAWQHGAASCWWLHHSLKALSSSLRKLGSQLIIRSGSDSQSLLDELIAQTKATHVYWNRLYEPRHIERDKSIKQALRDRGLEVCSFNGNLLFEPWQISKNDGGPFRVFTPFWKACVKSGLPGHPDDAPENMPAVSSRVKSARLESLGLLPKIRWDLNFSDQWQPGETGAHQRLDTFLDHAVARYQDDRNRPDIDGTSMMSAHLHFGEISPQQIIEKTNQAIDINKQQGIVANAESFVREIGWREFAYHLLYHFPHTVDRPLYEHFEDFPWKKNYSANLRAWQQGQTGIPLVDAGMRQLWHTGWMHNRVRMIVASLLTKNLLIPWQQGTRWFWDTLVDADLASNTLGWQWTAGCGADAAPYFRIFNPVTQAQKFDPCGAYIRQWIPEIAALPDKYLSQPWAAPAALLDDHNIKLGNDYPAPIVDLKATRERALERYQTIKKS